MAAAETVVRKYNRYSLFEIGAQKLPQVVRKLNAFIEILASDTPEKPRDHNQLACFNLSGKERRKASDRDDGW